MSEIIRSTSRKRRAFYVALVLILGMITRITQIKPQSVETLTLSNTISAYLGVDGVFEMPLDGLLKQQSVRVYFRVSDGRAKAALYDDAGKKIKPERDLALSHDVYRIPTDGNYCLRIEANAASFTISVSVMDTKEQ